MLRVLRASAGLSPILPPLLLLLLLTLLSPQGLVAASEERRLSEVDVANETEYLLALGTPTVLLSKLI